MTLKNSHILITGGSLGIGKATANILAQSGAVVAITGRSAERLDEAALETNLFGIVADVSQPNGVESTYSQYFAKFSDLDVLINNAGVGGTFPKLVDSTVEEYEEVFRTNVFGAAMMAKRAVQYWLEQKKSGIIVNIGSTASLRGFERGGIYAASKFALRGMSESWAAELRRHNIKVIQINPSEVATAFGSAERTERQAAPNKLRPEDIAYSIKAVLEADDRAMTPEISVWATNPW